MSTERTGLKQEKYTYRVLHHISIEPSPRLEKNFEHRLDHKEYQEIPAARMCEIQKLSNAQVSGEYH